MDKITEIHKKYEENRRLLEDHYDSCMSKVDTFEVIGIWFCFLAMIVLIIAGING